MELLIWHYKLNKSDVTIFFLSSAKPHDGDVMGFVGGLKGQWTQAFIGTCWVKGIQVKFPG